MIENADVTALAPGTEKIFILFLIASFTKIEPGSEIDGVPASDIIDKIFLSLKRSIILSKFSFSLNLWFEINFLFICYLFNNFLETLVSSHNM